MQTHKDLRVWQEAINFVTLIYKETENYPKREIYGLTSQLRRAAVSIPSNISEGSARKGIKEKIHFFYISLASNTEIETQLIISKNLNFINLDQFKKLEEQNQKIGKLLVNLIHYLENKRQ